MAPSNNNKKRATKGKALSEQLREKDAKKAAEAAELEADLARERAEQQGDVDETATAEDEDVEERETDDEPSDEGDEDAEREESGDDEGDEEEELVAGALGYQRWVVMAFVTVWLLAAYVLGRALREGWADLAAMPKFVQAAPQLAAIPHEGELLSRTTISTLFGVIAAGALMLHYYRRADVREWADEVADEVSKVKWPTRKEIGNYTVIVIAGSALLTAYLTLLDRFWAFVTNLIYSTGA